MTKRLSSVLGGLKVPNFFVLIPARYDSARLPGKALLDIAGKPMVVRVAERAKLSGATQVMVATDDQRILQAVNDHGFAACMTKTEHVSGTDRIAEVATQQGWADDAIVVNVQGDEPLIVPDLIAKVAAKLNDDGAAVMATACYAITSLADFQNPNVVKVVLDDLGHAMYFSRSPIPYNRNAASDAAKNFVSAYRHVGIYAYRVKFLKQFASLPAASLERMEGLEQLRALQQGCKIAVYVSDQAPVNGVDSMEDLDVVRARFQSHVS